MESESMRGQNEERDYSPRREKTEALDDLEENWVEKSRASPRHRSKDKKKTRREEKDHRSKDRERLRGTDGMKETEKETQDSEMDRVSRRERRKEGRDEHEKDKAKDKVWDKDYDRSKHRDKGREKDKDRKDHGKERDHGRETEMEKDVDRSREKDRGKEKSKDRDKEKEKDNYRERHRARDWEREYGREKHKDREEREYGNDGNRFLIEVDRGMEKVQDEERPERGKVQDKERPRDRDNFTKKNFDDGHDRSKEGGRDGKTSLEVDAKDADKPRKDYRHEEDNKSTIIHRQKTELRSDAVHSSTRDFEERIVKMKEERLKNKSSGVSEVLTWVSRSRKLEEERSAEKEKALRLSRVFEERDNLDQEESEDEAEDKHTAEDLAGVKVLHGLDKVVEGGAVVLTLKDQSILADGGINEEIDMLENVEIGEQRRRDEAYIAAKKKTGVYEDKFNTEPGSEKKILPQYDDPVAEEGLTLDEKGRFSGEAEKKLEELRKRIQGVSANNQYEDLNSSGKISSDYYTQEEMLRFKKPKKKKSLRKKERLDINALEAEAVAAGLGAGDLGSRNDGKRQAMREEQERSKAEMRNNAYQSAYAKADEASKALRLDQTLTVQLEDENSVFGNDDEDLYKSLERARKVALKNQDEDAVSGPKALALLASTSTNNVNDDGQNPNPGETQENKVVFTEMEEFVWGLQLDQETQKPDSEDVFMEEDEAPKVSDREREVETSGWKEVDDTGKDEDHINEHQEEVVPDATIHEAAVGKGLSGALNLLKERGSLKESVEWGGRNMDKKKSKLAGLHDNEGTKEIRLERTDEFGRIMTPKEAFRRLSHKFHGKDPGKMKQEKRQKQFMEDLKLKQMKNSDTPSLSVERMREAQARLKTPYLVLSGQVKPGQTSDPKSGFATVEKDLPGGLTPMLGDRKVEHFLGIKRKAVPGTMAPPKKPKT